MIDIFNNYELQREELLARIAQELELDPSRVERMEQAYEKVLKVLRKDEVFFRDLEIELYSQGSVRISTTVKPLGGEDFDLDTVLHIYDLHSNFDPNKVYTALVRVIENDAYYSTICKKKDRCVRLDFKNDFHIDILPGCMVEQNDRNRIAIPEKKLRSWSSGNPRGFGDWFLAIAQSPTEFMLKSFSDSLIKAEVDAEPLPDTGIYEKTPLQRSVQLVKRYRDVYFEDKDFKVSSIVITTLMGMFYANEQSIYETIDNALHSIKNSYNKALEEGKRFKVMNPVDQQEDFTDSWTEENYRSFYHFIEDFYSRWELLKNAFDQSGVEYVRLFGEGPYKNSLKEQIRVMSRFSRNTEAVTSSYIIDEVAKTDEQGQINQHRGVKNEPHYNFGG